MTGTVLLLLGALGVNLVKVRRIPLDPPWLIVPILVGLLLGAASIWNESWSIAVLFAGWLVAFLPALIGFERWYEQRHPGGRLR